jgi:hypothetical protein
MDHEIKIGDRVRYVGTANDDIYHGECVGREGVVKTVWPIILVHFGDEMGVRAVGDIAYPPILLELVH